MRNGDAYKIKSLHQSGVSESDIIHAFKNLYEAKEVKKFFPKPYTPPVPKTKPKPKRVAKPKAS
jgi:hypothetical protein